MADNILYKETYNGHPVEIHRDDDQESPRQWDNLGTLVTFHRRHELGDINPKCSPLDWLKGQGAPEAAESIQAALNALGWIWLPVFLYDHGGLSISTSPFNGRAPHAAWDSGQLGFIYVESSKVKETYQVGNITPVIRQKAINCLVSEIKVLDDHLQGRAYGYIVYNRDHTDIVCSCWGYYPEEGTDPQDLFKDGLNEARGEVDWLVQHYAGQALFLHEGV